MSDPDREYEELCALAASEDPKDVDRAHEQALIKMGKAPRLKTVAAMAYDRSRALAGRPQKFGTQSMMQGGRRVLWPVDPGTTDSERAKWQVSSLRDLEGHIDAAPEVTKALLRRRLRQARESLSDAQLQTFAERMADHGLGAIPCEAPAVIAAYWPLRGEADPRELARRLAARHGARLALPVVVGDDLSFREWRDDAELVPAGFGTLGPAPEAPELTPSIVLTPLVGFDRVGGRLGQGKGYYDRQFAQAPARPLVVGVACSCQEVAAVPTEPHDRQIDVLVTEREVLTFGR